MQHAQGELPQCHSLARRLCLALHQCLHQTLVEHLGLWALRPGNWASRRSSSLVLLTFLHKATPRCSILVVYSFARSASLKTGAVPSSRWVSSIYRTSSASTILDISQFSARLLQWSLHDSKEPANAWNGTWPPEPPYHPC